MKELTFKKSERTDFADFNCHWSTAPYIGMHLHTDWYEIVIATDVSFYHRIGAAENHLQRVKDVFILKPGVPHALYGVGDQKAVHYNIAVRTVCFDSFIRNKDPLKKHFAENDSFKFTLPDITFPYLRMLIDKLDNERYDTYNTTLMETILHTVMFSAMDELKWVGAEKERIGSYCKDALTKIDNYSFIAKSAAEIYKNYPVSHTSFIAEFKRLCGVPPSQYLMEKKMAYAKALLLTTDLSVLQIAEELRYSSVSYFIKKFKDLFGLTPLQYRRDNSGKVLLKHVE